MKRCTLFFFAVLLSYKATAQLLSGKINNLKDHRLIIITNDNYLLYHSDTIMADRNGRFAVRLKMPHSGYATIRNNEFETGGIFFAPNTELVITADGEDQQHFFNSVYYKGTAALPNNYNADIVKHLVPLVNRNTYNLPEEEFATQITLAFKLRYDTARTAWFSKLSGREKSRSFIKDFRMADSVERVYYMVNSFLIYHDNFLIMANRPAFFDKYIRPYASVHTSRSYLSSPNYRWFWNKLIQSKYAQNSVSHSNTPKPAWYNYYIELPKLVNECLDQRIKPVVCASLEESLTYNYKSCADTILPILDKTSEFLLGNIRKLSVVASYRQRINQLKNERVIFAKGQSAPNFTLVDSNGKSFSLADFKGKVVYMDVWASWCGPCIVLFPAARRLEEKFKDDDRIVFLSVSADSKSSLWLKAVQQYHPAGHQLWASDGFSSKFIKDYHISSIPKYLIIDPNGKIVTFPAPRPDDEYAIFKLLHETSL